ncbi:hypothetical protein BH20ACT6_BH20ACT6_18580 [soil metagenome]
MPLTRTTRALAVLAVAVLPVAAGCSGDGDDAPPEPDVSSRLESARAQLDEATSLQVRLVSDNVPDGTVGLIEADGVGNHDPAFEGVVTVVTGGLGQVDADVVSVRGDVEAKVGFVPTYAPVDPDDLGAPDPAALLSTENGVSSWLTQTEKPVAGEDSRDGEVIVTGVSGTLPGAVVKQLIPTADDTADFDVVYRLTDDDALRDAAITGPFYPDGADVTYDLTVTTSDQPVDIELPSKSDTGNGA